VRLYCATSNPGKLREFIQIVGDVEPLPDLKDIVPPDETGETFEENAAQKAIYYSRFAGAPVFVDDSGLEVDGLGGAPGVYSARFAGPDATDEANNRLVIEKMRGETNRIARFVCVVALAKQGELIRTFRGEVEGQLLDAPRGSNGFGYDPLFFYPPFGCSFGEVAADRKMQVSHRGRALRAMREYLNGLLDA
jgi:XTP/dITP diphosphohydrolase